MMCLFYLCFIILNVNPVLISGNTNYSGKFFRQEMKYCEMSSKPDQGICIVNCFNPGPNNISVPDGSNNECNEQLSYIVEIRKYSPPNETLTADWFNIPALIYNLTISSSNIKIIQTGAFKNDCFSRMNYLGLRNLKLIHLHKGMFDGIQLLYHLEIDQTSILEKIDICVLDTIKDSLDSLFISANLSSPSNLTNGISLLSGTTWVKLNKNRFYRRITKDSFDQLSAVTTLNLAESKINFLPNDVFKKISMTLKSIDLRQNYLQVLYKDVLAPILNVRSIDIFLFSGNPWVCNCYLQKLVGNLESNKNVRYDNETGIECPRGQYLLVKNLKICEQENLFTNGSNFATSYTDNSEITEFPLTFPFQRTTTIQTTPILDKNSKMYLKQVIPCCPSEEVCNKYGRTKIQMRRKKFKFSIRKVKDDKTILSFRNKTKRLTLIWFSNISKNKPSLNCYWKPHDFECMKNFRRQTSITTLKKDTAYLFCLTESYSAKISPFDCKPWYTYSTNENVIQSWISLDMKCTTISLSALGIILITILGALSACFLPQKRKNNHEKRAILITPDSGNFTKYYNSKYLYKRKILDSTEDSHYYSYPQFYEILISETTYQAQRRMRHKKRCSNDPLPRIPS